MGPGGSHEAAFTLKAPVAAGMYHFELDAVVIQPVDVTFDLIWRRGTTDMPLTTWMEHYDPLPSGNYDAQPFDYDMGCSSITWQKGDQLVFRYTGANTTSQEAYIPNGDGVHSNGRIPSITLP